MTVAPRLACSAGSARLTTLPSIKARLDPRIVAARIHGAAFDEHGAAAGAERITPSSHGCAIEGLNFMGVALYSITLRHDRYRSASPIDHCFGRRTGVPDAEAGPDR